MTLQCVNYGVSPVTQTQGYRKYVLQCFSERGHAQLEQLDDERLAEEDYALAQDYYME